MTEPAAVSGSGGATKAKRQLWDQQPGENDLWYNRFVRFVALGPSRSISLLSRGKRNAYPVPAHWPIQAKQLQWRERAKAFDEAAKADPRVIQPFNTLLEVLAQDATNGEAGPLAAAVLAGGYVRPTDEDEDELQHNDTN